MLPILSSLLEKLNGRNTFTFVQSVSYGRTILKRKNLEN